MDRIRRVRRGRIGLALVVLIVAGGLASGPWFARQAGRYLMTTEPLERADAIVVLAAYAPDRALEAADLYEEGYAPRILFSTEERPSATAFRRMEALGITVPESHDLMRSIVIQRGVPPEAAQIVDSRGNSTWMEAVALRAFLEQKGIRSVIAVTSKSHTNRVGRIFRRAFGDRVRVVVRASRYDDFDPDAWWRTRWQARAVLYEYLKLIDYTWTILTRRSSD
jgi:uncharacterized SAM-binding protein YcdF (DUF218 family)